MGWLFSILMQKPVNAEGEPSASATMDVETMVQESISVGIDSNGLAFSVTPTSGGTFSAQSLNVHVYTNAKGYKLYISNKTAETALKHTDSSISTGIPTLTATPSSLTDLSTGGIAKDAFPANSWGFSLNGNNYFGVSYTNPTLIKDTDNYTDIGDSVTQIYFGTKVDTDLPAGTYQNTVLITAAATEVPPLAPGIGGTTNPSDPGDHNGWTEGTEVSVTETGTSSFGVDHYEYYIMNQDGSQATPFSLRFTPSKPDFDVEAMGVGETVSITSDHYADGIYYVFFRTVDKNGRKSDWSDGTEVKLDTTNPTVTYLARTSHNTFTFTIADNMSLGAYCVNTSDSAEGCSWQAMSGTEQSDTFTISASANNWHVWAKDSYGHVNELVNSKSIESFKVTRSAANATLTTKYESATGTAFENETYVLKDTPIYVEAQAADGYADPTITFDGTPVSSGSINIVTKETLISAGSSDATAPTASISASTSAGSTTQTVDLSCSDNVSVSKYYFGTNSNPADSDFQDADNQKTWTKQETVNAADTYYLFCKDNQGNVKSAADTAKQAFYTYQVRTVLDTVSGSATTYNSSNFAETGNNSETYLASAGMSIQPGDYKQVPTGSAAGNYKGWSTTFNTTTVSPSTSTATINANTTFYAWFIRNTYKVSLTKGTGISAVSGAGTYKYGATASLGATVTNGYTWVNWTGSSTITNQSTSVTVTSALSYTANAADKTAPTGVTITRKSFKTFTVSATDAVGATGYYVSVDSTTAPTTSSTWTSMSTTYTASNTTAAHTYRVWVRDAAGNISSNATTYSYLVTRSQGSNTTLTTYYDSSVSGTTCSGGTSFTSNTSVLTGTPVCASATAKSGYNLATFKWGSTNILSSAGGYSKSVTAAVTISTTAAKATIATAGTLQGLDSTACSNTASGTTANLKDARDNKSYLTAKLADGHCWMTQNLALGGSSAISLNTTYSNLSYTLPASSSSGFSSNTAANVYVKSHTDNTQGSTSNTGGYYTWCAATAGKCGNYSSGNTATTENICPKGWRLPTRAEITILYNNSSTYASAFKIGLVGLYYSSSLDVSGSVARWWSSTAYGITDAYYLVSNRTSSFNGVDNYNRSYGLSVRCML